MIDEKVLRNEEKTVFELRSLYGKYGYVPLRMSKFEEYELYSHNKDFLDSDQIITFNDINGKLMAHQTRCHSVYSEERQRPRGVQAEGIL